MLNKSVASYLQNFCYADQLSMALLYVSHPLVQICGGEDILYFQYFLDTLSSGPQYKFLFGGGLPGCTLLQSDRTLKKWRLHGRLAKDLGI